MSNKDNYSNFTRMRFIPLCLVLSVIIAGLCVVAAISSLPTLKNFESNKMKLIVDTDAGTDDAFALFYLLRAERYATEDNNSLGPDILGITCVNGNTKVDNVVINVLKVLKAVNRLDIPVYKGLSRSIVVTPEHGNYFGHDGMGDIPSTDPPSPDLAQKEHAVDALVRLVNENPGEITLLAMGPLTNIAMASRMDDGFLKKLKKLIILGGSIEGKGNMMPGVEFNFYMDPVAAHIILSGNNFHPNSVMMLPWEAMLAMNVTTEWRKKELAVLTSTEIKFMNEVEHVTDYPDTGVWLFADPVLAVISVQPELIGRVESYAITTVMQGPTCGGIAVDYTDILKSKYKVDIVYDIDATGYKNTLLKHFE